MRAEKPKSDVLLDESIHVVRQIQYGVEAEWPDGSITSHACADQRQAERFVEKLCARRKPPTVADVVQRSMLKIHGPWEDLA